MQNSKQAIHYSIKPIHPEAHLYEIRCEIARPNPAGQIVWLPAWIPGSYMIRDFAKNIISIQAESAQQSLSLQKLDKQRWQVEACTPPIQLIYTVYAWDMSVRTAHLDQTHGFFNGSSVFVAVQGQEDQPCSVDIQLPEGDAYVHWRVATGLARDAQTELFKSGRYLADDYDALIDHPVEMGNFSEAHFVLDDVPHHIVISGRHQTHMPRLLADVEKICRTHIDMFGELPVMERYVFLLTVVGEGYGGLEHRNSTALICSRKDLPHQNMDKPSDGYITLLGLFSHEYFHTWNVKRIKPASFIPYQLEQESYTTLLWAFEGITSYYDELGLVRSGVITEDDYLTLIGKNITRVMRGSGRLKQTLSESSFDAWTRFYKQDENAVNAIVSYYAKGGLFAFCLDTVIRQRSNQQHSLDDVMRQLWLQHGRPLKGVEYEDILTITHALCDDPVDDFFDEYLNSTRDLPLENCFANFAIELKWRTATSLDDAGGRSTKAAASHGFLGARFEAHPAGIKVLVVFDEGDIQQAGIASGDIIIALDGLKISKENLLDRLAIYQPGDQLEWHVFRRDELFTTKMSLSAAREDTAWLQCDNSHVSLKALRQQWLGTSSTD